LDLREDECDGVAGALSSCGGPGGGVGGGG